MVSVNFQPVVLPVFSLQHAVPALNRFQASESGLVSMASMRVGMGVPTGSVLRFAESSEIVVQMMAGRSGGGTRSGGGEAPPPAGNGDGDGNGGRGRTRRKIRGATSGAAPMPLGGDKPRPARSPYPMSPAPGHELWSKSAVSIDTLGVNLSSHLPDVRKYAVFAFSHLGKEDVRGLEEIINTRLTAEDDPMIRASLMTCAILVKSHKIAWSVAGSLSHEVEAVRSASAITLGEMGEFAVKNWMAGGSGILDKLTNVSLHDESEKVRLAAECALRKLGV